MRTFCISFYVIFLSARFGNSKYATFTLSILILLLISNRQRAEQGEQRKIEANREEGERNRNVIQNACFCRKMNCHLSRNPRVGNVIGI